MTSRAGVDGNDAVSFPTQFASALRTHARERRDNPPLARRAAEQSFTFCDWSRLNCGYGFRRGIENPARCFGWSRLAAFADAASGPRDDGKRARPSADERPR